MKSRHALIALSLSLCALQAPGFSQRTPVTSVGHEWLTVAGAAAAVKESPADAARLAGKGDWSGSGCEQGCPGHRYEAENYLVWSTTLGQRWVDLGGFSVEGSGHRTCWDALTQSPDDLQYDHFLRARGDDGPAGGLAAMNASVKRFRKYFLAAAAEKDGARLKFMDGGAVSGALGGEFTADRAYFLFGRAVHLFQDSFSLEHAVRRPADGFSKLYGIKSYVCSKGSPQHGHSPPGNAATLASFDAKNPSRSIAQLGGWGSEPSGYAKNGDVLWKSATGGYGQDNVKPHGQVAATAMKDLWLAFERVRAKKVPAEAAVDALISKWLTITGNGGDAVSFDASDCAKDASLKSNKVVEDLRAKCLEITGTNEDDRSRPPYTWTALGANWPDADLLEKTAALAAEAAEAAEEAAEDAKEAAEEAAEDAKDAADKTKDAAASKARKAAKAAKKAAKKAARKAKKKAEDALDVFR